MLSLIAPINQLRMVGKTIESRLKKLGIFTVEGLLGHYPFRYDDFSNLKKISELKAGESASIKGVVELLASRRSFKKRMVVTECFVSDESGSIKAVWFGQPFIAKVLKNGDQVYLSGQISDDLFNLYFKNPSYEKAYGQDTTHTARLVPIYPSTEGLSQKQIRFLVKQALESKEQLAEWLPEPIIQRFGLIGFQEAMSQIHFPKNPQKLEQAGRRLKFDELLNLQLQNLLLKKEVANNQAAPINFDQALTKKIVSNLDFELTDAQRKSAWQILQDMSQAKPMNRLLEGDVGSGKTVVMALAAANAILNGYQVAILAPTEILASQHFQTFKKILKVIDANIALLSSSKSLAINTGDDQESKLAKAKLLRSLEIGEINLVIGTHALIQENIAFKKLALIVVDEQHRFGVEQRKALREKSGLKNLYPHFLSVTATPIPRTLALTFYGDLEISLINEMPKNRKQPITRLIENIKRNLAYDFVLKQIQQGRQAFVICPLIDESDNLGVRAAQKEYEKLTEEIFPQLKIGLLHGRLKPKEKDKVMQSFLDGQLDILVSTSVVEVGVNVPNANIMIIESAERFGLAQLHQFRGRVNRSSHQSYCLLFNKNAGTKSLARLKTLVDCFDGFKLAEEDLKQRGSGDLYGIRQSGFGLHLKIASLSDQEILAQAKEASEEIIRSFPEIINRLSTGHTPHQE